MEIDIKLQEQGITENILNYFHSRTNNSHMTIIKAYPTVTYKGEENAGVKVNVTLQSQHAIISHAQYTIDIAKIRQKRLNLLLKTK
jgi:hypothetical protein